ncbi:high affinity immunoglobulin alpha and immunoglobulin mu Fc receptor [Python bivittatus]|uniref:high affinity immunoglobulin alpha and immunoglobulin mu Fc receptor n=1 Tax=Python bivittatus TaxID=176946 RepID=UPI000D6A5DD3|nr:high affinity immunoglobulin alpha and immunoglobulin mu Fc receptor [Python bivittatus]
MMLIIFILFTVMHVSDTLYGPRLLISHVGGSVTIKCYYVTTSVNRHDRKFFCKELPHKRCQTVISSNAFIHQDYKERVSMYNNPQKGILQVTMRQLTSRDSSNYRCGIGKISDGLYARMNLTILEGLDLPKSPQIVWGKLTGSVELQCPSETPRPEMRNILCKLIHTDCFPILDKSKSRTRQHSHRIIMTNGNSSGTFNVIINKLERKDSGIYICRTRKLDKNASARTIQLQVVEESVFSNILSDAQTTSESLTVNASSYWLMTSKDEVYKESSSYSEQNLLSIVIPVPVLLLLLAVPVILILVKIRRRKTASHNIISKSPEGELPLPTQKCLEEHPQNDNRNSADENESPLNSDEAEASITVYCLVSHGPDPEDSSKND